MAEIKMMGITKCPLCDSEGPQDSPELIEHVFHHVHSFSLRSLPWPMDPIFSLERSVGLFDMNRAFKMTKDDNGEEHVIRIDHWAETAASTFELEKGEETVIIDMGISGWPEDRTLESDQSLQLCDIDRNPPKLIEEEMAAIAESETDYFAQNDYFIDESDDGRFQSQTSHSSETQNSIQYLVREGPKNWVCTLCDVQSIQGDDAYYQHLTHSHAADMEEIATDVELWKCSMLNEAYWNGMDGIITSSSASVVDADRLSIHREDSDIPDTWEVTVLMYDLDCKECEVVALVDTGAKKSFISRSTRSQLGRFTERPIPKFRRKSYSGPTGGKTKPRSFIEPVLAFQMIEPGNVRVELKIIEDTDAFQIIAGQDAMKAYKKKTGISLLSELERYAESGTRPALPVRTNRIFALRSEKKSKKQQEIDDAYREHTRQNFQALKNL